MHLALLVPDLTTNHGWGTYSLDLLHALQAQGLRISLISARNSPALPGLDQIPLLPTLNPPDRASLLRMASIVPRLRSLLRDCDILHSCAEPYAPLLLALGAGRPLFQTIHGSYAYLPQLRGGLLGGLYARAYRASELLCVSRYSADVVQRVVPGARTRVINNGVDMARLLEAPAAEVNKRGPTVISTGGVKARKGTLQLVQAMAHVRQAVPGAQCVIMGSLTAEPAYVEQVRACIAAEGLEDCVHLLGFVDETHLRGWYRAADVFALPSRNAGWKFEGFGLVHLEAGAFGLPVIGSWGCGAEDAIDDGRSGYLIHQENSAQELPERLIRLLQDPALAQQMGAAAYQKASQHSWQRVGEQVIAAYRAALT